MRKATSSFFAIILMIVLSACNKNYNLSGHYVQSDETKYDTSVEVSYISLYDDNSCEFVVNYLQGMCVTKGTYEINGNALIIELTESEPDGFLGEKYVNGIQSHIAYRHAFTIIDESTLRIDEDVYAIQKDEIFIRQS